MPRPVVVFDLTPLATGSRYRGIGTYTLDLGRALALQAPDDLELRLLVGTPGRWELWPAHRGLDTDAVMSACGDEPTPYQRYYMQKRTRLVRYLDAAGVALVHAPDPKGTGAWGRHRTIVTAHDLIPSVMGYPYRWYPRWASLGVDRLRYGRHDHVVSISAWTARDLMELVGLPRGRTTVIHHGVDHERFHADGAADDPAPTTPYIFYVGGFDQRKQVPELIAAFGTIAANIGHELWIAGNPSPRHRRALDRAAAAAGIADRVRILGFVPLPDLPRLYRQATAHVLPTLYEGFGMTAVEAMACGCPPITLRASCVPEICQDAADYSEPGDWPAFASAIRRVATDPEHRSALRARGLARAASLTWERAAAETLAVYRRVLAP